MAYLQGLSSRGQDVRVRRALQNPSAPLRSWLADLCAHGRDTWAIHHEAEWSSLSALIGSLYEEGKLSEEQFAEIKAFDPDMVRQQTDKEGLTYDEIAAQARQAVARLREILPSAEPRIREMLDRNYATRYARFTGPQKQPLRDFHQGR